MSVPIPYLYDVIPYLQTVEIPKMTTNFAALDAAQTAIRELLQVADGLQLVINELSDAERFEVEIGWDEGVPALLEKLTPAYDALRANGRDALRCVQYAAAGEHIPTVQPEPRRGEERKYNPACKDYVLPDLVPGEEGGAQKDSAKRLYVGRCNQCGLLYSVARPQHFTPFYCRAVFRGEGDGEFYKKDSRCTGSVFSVGGAFVVLQGVTDV